MHRTLLLTSAAAALLFAQSAQAQTFTTLGSGIAEKISADGTTVVGGAGPGGAWTWTQATGQLDVPGGNWVYGVSFNGQTLFGDIGSDLDAGAVWTAATGWQGIGGVAGGSGTGCPNLGSPYGMSDGGDVATGLAWEVCDAFAYRWTPALGVEQLPQMGPFSSRGNDVSGDGTVIGGWDEATNGSRRAAIWFPDNSEQLLLVGSPGNPDGAGEVWGLSTDGSWISGSVNGTFSGAFRWSAGTGAEFLGALPAFQGATALAISDDGKTAVGFCGNAFFGLTGFIWTEASGFIRFRDFAANLGITLPGAQDFQVISDISADGKKIVGYYAADAGPFSPKTPFLLELPDDCGFAQYGVGASPTNLMTLDGGGGTSPGTTFDATTSGNPGTVTITAISRAGAIAPLFGGAVLIDLNQLLPLQVAVPAGGVSTQSFALPANPALVGQDYFLQSLADDPTQPEGVALSNGLELIVCP